MHGYVGLVEYLRKVVPNLRERRDGEIIGDCPECGAKQRFTVNPDKPGKGAVYNCYRCDLGGKLVDFLVQRCRVSHGDAFRLLRGDDVELTPDTYDESMQWLRDQVLGTKALRPPPGSGIVKYFDQFVPIGHGDVVADMLGGGFMERRGFTLQDCVDWALMYCPCGKFHDRIIIPVFEGPTMVYFQGRTITADIRKYFNPSSEDGCFRDDYVWNLDVASHYDTVYVVEGAFNGMTIGRNVVATFGAHMSESQITKLSTRLKPGTRVVLAYDYGYEAGERAFQAASALSRQFPVSTLLMPDDRDMNDWLVAGGRQAVEYLLQHNERDHLSAWDYVRQHHPRKNRASVKIT